MTAVAETGGETDQDEEDEEDRDDHPKHFRRRVDHLLNRLLDCCQQISRVVPTRELEGKSIDVPAECLQQLLLRVVPDRNARLHVGKQGVQRL